MKKQIPQKDNKNTEIITQNNSENQLEAKKNLLGNHEGRLKDKLDSLRNNFKRNSSDTQEIQSSTSSTTTTTSSNIEYVVEPELIIEQEVNFVESTDQRINNDLEDLQILSDKISELQQDNLAQREQAETFYESVLINQEKIETMKQIVNSSAQQINENSVEIQQDSETIQQVSTEIGETNQEMNTQVSDILDKVNLSIQKLGELFGGSNASLVATIIGVAVAAGGYYARYHGLQGFREIMGNFFWQNLRNENIPTTTTPNPVIPPAPSSEDTLDLVKQWLESSNKVVFGLMKALIDTIKVFKDKYK